MLNRGGMQRTCVAIILLLLMAVIATIRNTSNLKYWWNSNQSQFGQYNDHTKEDGRDNKTSIDATLAPQSTFLLPKNSANLMPVTILSRECSISPNQPLQKGKNFPEYENATRFWKPFDNDTLNNTATCRLRIQGTTHFPHIMQHLYACFSYWQERIQSSKNSGTTISPVLLVLGKTLHTLNSNPFLKGFFEVLQAQLGVEIKSENHLQKHSKAGMSVDNNNGTMATDSNSWSNVQEFNVSGGYILSNTYILNQLVHKHYFASANDTTLEKSPISISCTNNTTAIIKDRPRIGILNRKPSMGRSISNVEQITETLVNTRNNFSDCSLAPIEYFEEKIFQKQVSFFADVDILISPHGAQLTGILFMANKPCTQLLELFPSGYVIPSFFGSLARNADIGYSYLYLSKNPPQGEQAHDLQERIHARAQNLCPNPKTIIEVVQNLIADWQDCCTKLS